MNRVRRYSGENFLHPALIKHSRKFPLKVMIWSCFSNEGLGKIHICKGNMDTRAYIETLELNLFQSAEKMGLQEFLFIDDSAPCHRSKAVKEWIHENKISQISWPGNSPDLNPIENLWAILKHRVRRKPNTTKQQLLENIKNFWENDISIL